MKKKPNREINPAKEEVLKEASKLEMKTVTFQIPVDLHTNFKCKASQEKKTMKDVLIELMKQYTD